MMPTDPLEEICRMVVQKGATAAKAIHPGTVITSPWVRFKCQFGCPLYGQGHCCPPYTPDHHQTREMLDSYQRAVLVHTEAPKIPDRKKRFRKLHRMMVALEGELFKDGYYKSFVFLEGPCRLCDICGKVKGEPCPSSDLTRPAMEACGIDVYQTARNAGFFIQPLHDSSETQNVYCLLMLD
jgi:predicted metal-binding protein